MRRGPRKGESRIFTAEDAEDLARLRRNQMCGVRGPGSGVGNKAKKATTPSPLDQSKRQTCILFSALQALRNLLALQDFASETVSGSLHCNRSEFCCGDKILRGNVALLVDLPGLARRSAFARQFCFCLFPFASSSTPDSGPRTPDIWLRRSRARSSAVRFLVLVLIQTRQSGPVRIAGPVRIGPVRPSRLPPHLVLIAAGYAI